MGASRHNISQIFNAETFITGLLSGGMGIIPAHNASKSDPVEALRSE